MSNDCYNSIHVAACREQDLTEFLVWVAGPNGPLDFERIVPVPAIFDNLRVGSRQIGAETVNHWFAREGNGGELIDIRPLTYDEWQNLAETCVDNLHDWLCRNWGCKWCPDMIEHERSDLEASFTFYTPWDPPVPIVERLREQFPTLSIMAYFDEPGMQIAGYY